MLLHAAVTKGAPDIPLSVLVVSSHKGNRKARTLIPKAAIPRAGPWLRRLGAWHDNGIGPHQLITEGAYPVPRLVTNVNHVPRRNLENVRQGLSVLRWTSLPVDCCTTGTGLSQSTAACET